MTQKFSYHTHTNTFGVFDGQNSIKEMLRKAQEIGYTEIGISNHFILHKDLAVHYPMFFNDKQKLIDVYKKLKEELIKESQTVDIRVLFGLEVDFFSSNHWRNMFEDAVKQLEPDYLIGASHYLHNEDENKVYNIYTSTFTEEEMEELLPMYWDNLTEAVKSGYFNFMAHIDLLKIFNMSMEDKWLPIKEKFIQTIIDCKQPIELNTSGWNKAGEQHPTQWMLEALRDGGVPIVISDDAHSTEMLSQHYQKAESLLKDLSYTNRFKIS